MFWVLALSKKTVLQFKFQAGHMQSLYLMRSHSCVAQSKNARNSLPCYSTVPYAVLGVKPAFKCNCVLIPVTAIPQLLLCHPLWF